MKHQNKPKFKKEDWIEHSGSELRTSIIQHLGDYISKFRKLGWNYGYDVNLFHSFIQIFLFLCSLSINLTNVAICNSNDSRD